MAVEDVGQNLEAIERQAEKVLEEARARHREIVDQARKERDRILASELAVDEIRGECRKVVDLAEQEAEQIVEKAAREAEKIRTKAEGKVEQIVQRMVRAIRGE